MQGHAATQDFHRTGGGPAKLKLVDRGGHGTKLVGEADSTFATSDAERLSLQLSEDDLRALGTVLVLEGNDDAYPLKLDSLNRLTTHTRQPKKPRWMLLSVRPPTDTSPEQATVWVADEHRAAFLKLFQDYLDVSTANGNPKNRELVANISRIRTAVLTDLWTSDGEPPVHGKHWWEVWLDATSQHVDTIHGYAAAYNLRALPRSIRLRDRVVFWIEATWAQLEILPFTAVPLAEIRRPEFIETVEDLPLDEQNEYVVDLADRIVQAPDDAPAVCHLDTGVLRTHLLLNSSLAESDHHTIFGVSGNDVHKSGHGTSMAGLALFGDLDQYLQGAQQVNLLHRLESVRIAPGSQEVDIDPLDYGSATVQAVALPEIAHSRRRVFCLTLSTRPDNPGEPTLWSAAVGALAVGTDSARDGDQFQLISAPDPDAARLILVAAGNVDDYKSDYRANSEISAVEDPGQSWNALTVGAYTELTDTPQHPQYAGWVPLANPGELSPHSRTSHLFGQRKWPIKPDICMEGGNVLSDGNQMFEPKLPSLSLRSTSNANDSALTSANATSAATAQASRLAALAMGRYPEYWPETVRGLLTHSAEWSPAMNAEVASNSSKTARLQLLRNYGWGVPTEEAVLNSSKRAVTLVTQDQFVPFDGQSFAMRRFRLHKLPWPTEVLQELGANDVRLRITLSYFIEPTASRRGWRQRYAYASHSLRFDLQGPLETQQGFISRINREAQSDEYGASRSGTRSDRWLLGENQRKLGSLHQDEWHGTGSELAMCNSVAVYPVGGWWKNNNRADRRDFPVRYGLLLSLTTAEQDIDLYTPIATQLRIPIATEISGT